MDKQEITKTPTTALKQRLAVVDFSTIERQAIEAQMIRSELARRVARAF